MAAGVPLVVDLEAQRVVVVGAGAVASRKVATLLGAHADVVVIAPTAVADIQEHATAGRLRWEPRAYERGDLAGAVLAVAATSETRVNARVAADASERAILCVRADGGGTASFSAAVRRGPLTLAVGTDGAAPALARRIRAELQEAYGPEYGVLAELLGRLRVDADVADVLRPLPPAERAARWRSVLDTDILSLIRDGFVDQAEEVARSCLSSSSG